MTEHPNLAAALVAFQTAMPKVHKGKTANVPTKAGGSYSYTYADLADVVEAATPHLTANGLAFTARPRRSEQGDYELAGVLTHTSGEEVEGSLPILGRTAQEIGSSITYGRRYLLGCMTGIVTDDDDDGSTASNTTERTRRAPSEAERRQKALNAAKGRVKGAWEARGWSWDQQMVAAEYATWANGSDLAQADVTDLDAFTAHLSEVPNAD